MTKVVVLLCVLASCVIAPEPELRHAAYEDVRRVVALLDDVAAEYPRAIAEGRVVSATRMKVIDTMLHDMQLFGSRFADDEQEALVTLAAAVGHHAEPRTVVETARALRRQLVTSYGLVLAPAAPLDRMRAVQEWDMLCAGCHGIAGMGDGPQGLGLDPEPKDFHEWAFMAELAPSRAFSQIADGVRATTMPQWGVFSTRERWGLAFLVFGFRYDAATMARGRAVALRAAVPTSTSSGSDRTDREVLEDLRARGLDDASANDALAYLRGAAPFEAPTGPLGGVRRPLGELATSYPARGDEPRRLFEDARDQLRESLVAIRARDPHVAARLERRFAELDHAVAADAMNEVVERTIARLGPALDEGEEAMRAPSVSGTARLACEWALAAALALGLVMSRRRRAASAAAVTAAIAAALAAAIGAHVAALQVALVAATLVAFVAARAGDPAWPTLSLAALAGAPIGVLARGLVEVHGARALVPLGTAVAALVLATAVARAVRSRAPWLVTVSLTIAMAVAIGGAAGRAAAQLAGSALLMVRRIECLGVMPSTVAVATAASAAVVAALVAFRYARRCRGAG